MATYKLVWDDFCSVLLEIIKPNYGKSIDTKTYNELVLIFERNLIILHPFMPFISEEIWHLISPRVKENALIISKWPSIEKSSEENLIFDFDSLLKIVSGIRNFRKKHQVSFKDSIELSIVNNDKLSNKYDSIITKLCNVSEISYRDSEIENSISFRVNSNIYSIPFYQEINIEEELIKINEDLNYQKGFLKSVEAKLSNKSFSDNAPEIVINMELKKENDALSKIKVLKERLKKLDR